MRAYGSLDEMLADKGVDLAVIATPDRLHGQQALRALQAGKHVLSGIIFVLKPGIPSVLLPQWMGYGSRMTYWRRRRDWQEAGVRA